MLLSRLVHRFAPRTTPGRLLRRGSPEIAGCREVKARLQGYAEGSTDASTRLRVGRHVSACRRCTMLVEIYSSLRAAAAARNDDLHSGAASPVEADGRRAAGGTAHAVTEP
jgi:hypothetical protein